MKAGNLIKHVVPCVAKERKLNDRRGGAFHNEQGRAIAAASMRASEQKREKCLTRLSRSVTLSVVALGTAILGLSVSAQAEVPSNTKLVADDVSPTSAWQYYGSTNVHTDNSLNASQSTLELEEIARSLGSDRLNGGGVTTSDYIDNTFNYVKKNIEVEHRFGLGKGARGALIDQSGTPFDQAHLFSELLALGGVSSSYSLGAATLSKQQFGEWTGLISNYNNDTQTFSVSANAACRMMADGGIPVVANGASSCANVTGELSDISIGHIVVDVAGQRYDPSFKALSFYNGLDLKQIAGCSGENGCGQSAVDALMSGAQTGAESGASFYQNLNASGLANLTNSRAVAIQQYIDQNEYDKRLIEIVGGRELVSIAVHDGTAGLPYSFSQEATWSDDIPDQYRTKFYLAYSGVSAELFADEVSGQRLRVYQRVFTGGNTYERIFLEDTKVDEVPYTSYGNETPLTLQIDFPYAGNSGTFADVDTFQMMSGGSPISRNHFSVIFQLGKAASSSVSHFSRLEKYHPTTGGGSFFTNREQGQQNAAYNLINHAMQVMPLVEGISGSLIAPHAYFGVSYSHGIIDPNVSPTQGTRLNPGLSLQSIVSSNSPIGSNDDESASFEMMSALISYFEGLLFQQRSDTSRNVSAIGGIAIANSAGDRIYHIPSSAAPNLSILTNYSSARIARIGNILDSSGYDLLLPKDGIQSTDFVEHGAVNPSLPSGFSYMGWGGSLAFKSNQNAYLLNEVFKGGASTPDIQDPSVVAEESVRTAEIASMGGVKSDVSLLDGTLSLQASPDIITGIGDFPSALSLQRSYKSGDGFERYKSIGIVPGDGNGPFDDSTQRSLVYDGSDQAHFARIGGGWTHNYQISASIGSDLAQSLGADSALDASAIIAAGLQLFESSQLDTVEGRLATIFTIDWFGSQTQQNMITISQGSSNSVFLRTPDGAFNPPPGSAAQVELTGAPILLDFGLGGGTYSYENVQINHTSASRDVQTFSPNAYFYDPLNTGPSGIATGQKGVFKIDDWSFPSGVDLSFSYNLRFYGGIRFFALNKVENNLGRSLTFTTSAPLQQSLNPNTIQNDMIDSVQDENGRTVTYDRPQCVAAGDDYYRLHACPELRVIYPDQSVSRYTYVGHETFSIAPYLLEAVHLPNSSGSSFPYVGVSFGSLERVASLTDARGNSTIYYPGGLFQEVWARGQSVNPVGDTLTTYFDERGNAVRNIAPDGDVSDNRYDGIGRQVYTSFREGSDPEDVDRSRTAITYDRFSNVLVESREGRTDTDEGVFSDAPLVERRYYDDPNFSTYPTKIVDAAGYSQATTYNSYGLAEEVVGPFLDATPTNLADDASCDTAGIACQQYDYASFGGIILETESRTKRDGATCRRLVWSYDGLVDHYQPESLTEHPTCSLD